MGEWWRYEGNPERGSKVSEDGRHRHPEKTNSLWSLIAALTAVVGLLLLAAVVIVGLARNDLDATGVATVLGTLVSAVVVGVIVKGGGDH